MIAPEGYFIWEDLQGSVSSWVATIESRQPKIRPRNFRLEALCRGMLEHYLIANFLTEFPPVLCSTNGSVFRAPSYLWLHADRLDYCARPEFSQRGGPYHLFYQLGESGAFTSRNFAERFCAIDAMSGLVKLKNNTKALFITAGLDQDEAVMACSATARLQGLSLCWGRSSIPSSLREIFTVLQIDEFFAADAGEENASLNTVRQPGRPSEVPYILAAYDEVYPEGHKAAGHYWDTVAEKLSCHLNRPLKKDTVARAVNRRSTDGSQI